MDCDAPPNFTYLGVIFGHDVEHAPTYRKPAFFFVSEKYDRNSDPKKYKATLTCVEKKKGRLSVCCTCGPKKRLKQIENREIDRGIAEMPLFRFIVVSHLT